MNAGNQPLIILQMNCESAVFQVTTTLKSAGYLVLKSFDLNSAAPAPNTCNCSTDSCTCQMVILLVYAKEGPPATLVFDSNRDQTIVYLVKNLSAALPVWIESLIPLLQEIVNPAPAVIPSVE
jgi:hypothetical protein